MNATAGDEGRELVGMQSGDMSGGGLWSLAGPVARLMVDRIDRGIEAGSLDATLPDGSRRVLGGRGPGPMAVIELHNWRALLRLAMDGSTGWYEGWTKGEWASPDPVQIFALFSR